MLARLITLLSVSIVVLAGCGEPDIPTADENATSARGMELAAGATMSAAESRQTATPAATATIAPTSTSTPVPTATATTTPTPTVAPATATPEPTATPTAVPPPAASGPELVEARVVSVIDGDTIKVSLGGQVYTVRLIGVDTPETVDPNEPVMCYGVEATAFTRDMISRASNRVLLEKDVSEVDRYGRLLCYVWLPHPDGTRFLNEELVKHGYAQATTYPPDVRFSDLFVQRMREARTAGLGLWGDCGGFGVPAEPTPTPTEPPPPLPPPPAPSNCDPSYPDVCIPPYPPDLDCPDIPYRNFRVVGSDPHRFDGDKDGWGCEG